MDEEKEEEQEVERERQRTEGEQEEEENDGKYRYFIPSAVSTQNELSYGTVYLEQNEYLKFVMMGNVVKHTWLGTNCN